MKFPKDQGEGVGSTGDPRAYRMVDEAVPMRNGHCGGAPLWHGWALRAAFAVGYAAAVADSEKK